jgi:uncharacterized glyoxalase superfamily protein PhnB
MNDYPTVAPMLAYADAVKALDWLPTAFGCEVRNKYVMDDGRIGHAELHFPGNGVVMLAEHAAPYQGPKQLAANYPPATKWYDTPYIVNGVWVQVDDVDAHFARAKANGAEILSDPIDEGHGKSYRTADLEGHRWMFSQR